MGAGLVSFLPLIIKGLGDTISLLGRSGGPDTPGVPKLNKLDVQGAKKKMEEYEAQRMQASIDAWKQKFPDLYKGGQYMVSDIAKQQAGMLGGNIAADMAKSGLGPVNEGDQYRLSQDIGLSPITLSQRTSQAVTRQIAQNPEWTNQITGGTLATMIANNYKNQNAFTQFLGANQTAQYAAQQGASAYNTQALLSGLTGGARLGAQIYNQGQYGPLSPTGQGIYQGSTMQQQAPPQQYQTQYPPPMSQAYNNSLWGMPGQQSTGFGTSMFGGGYNNPYIQQQYGNANPMMFAQGPILPPASDIYGSGYGNDQNLFMIH